MKTNYSAFTLLGSQINTDSLSSALDDFKTPNVKFVQNNKTGEILRKREHVRVGTLHTGIRFMGNIKIYECNDTGIKITGTGEILEDAIKRISEITKNRSFETSYSAYETN